MALRLVGNMNITQSEELENIRRTAENGLAQAQNELHSSNVDLFQHILDIYKRIEADA